MSNTGASAQFAADRPISKRADDLLGRSSFAEAIAKAIAGWSGAESLVVAVCGAWGSGKSSVKNMILDTLRDNEFPLDRRPAIVDFNPWQISGLDQITTAFFGEIGIALGQSFEGDQHNEVARKWSVYAASVGVGRTTTELLRRLAIIVLVIGTLFFGLSWLSPSVVRISSISLVLLALLAAFLSRLGGWFRSVASLFEARAQSTERSLLTIRTEVADLLKTLKHPVLVVMDDVDRLTKEEMQLIFQLIKANADFPNLVYMLFFQRSVVEKSLEGIASSSGREYLKKMVQVDLDLPSVEDSKLGPVLFSHLDRVLEIETLGERFDLSRWQRLHAFGLRPYLTSLRDVYRFTNTLGFQLGLLRRHGTLDVNAIDLIGLETLRVFEPDVYQELPKFKGVLTGIRGWEGDAEAAKSRTKNQIEAIVKLSSNGHEEEVKEILTQLFPPVDWVFGGLRSGLEESDDWLRDLRVCSGEMFDRYFLLAIPEGGMSEEEFGNFMSSLSDRGRLVAQLKEAAERKTLEHLLGRLGARVSQVDLAVAVPFITSLFDIGDNLPHTQPGGWIVGIDRVCWLIIRRMLERENDQVKRSKYLRSAIETTDGLYLPLIAVFYGAEPEKGKDPRARPPLLVGEDLRAARELLLVRIRDTAMNNGLSAHPELPFILYRWHELGPESEPRGWVENLISKKEGLLRFLKAFTHKDVETELLKGTSQVRTRIDTREIEKFVPISRIQELLKDLPEVDLVEEDRDAVTAFRRAIEPPEE